MTTSLIPERGWHPMVDAEKDVREPIVVMYHEFNKPGGAVRVQFARWSMNPYGEWAWRPAWRADGGTVNAEGWMRLAEYQSACEALAGEQNPSFDL